jgi:hypothetical protein
MRNDYIEIVSEFEQDWIGIASTYVGEEDASEAVQEMYLKIGRFADERIIKEDGDIQSRHVDSRRSDQIHRSNNRHRYR